MDVHNVHAYILGEHGDSELPAWSMTNVAGIPIEEFCPSCEQCGNWELHRKKIVEDVKNSAYHIIDCKGSTCFGVGMALTRIAGVILRNQNSVLTVSAVLEGEYGLSGVSLGVPCIVSLKGVERILRVNLPPAEQGGLEKSAAILKEMIGQLKATGTV
jgi:L-lactate dehydrogenase